MLRDIVEHAVDPVVILLVVAHPTNHQYKQPVTPDGRYFVVRGRLWRCSNPALPAGERSQLVRELMAARRAKGVALRTGDAVAREKARREIEDAKRKLGERGPVWWNDGSPDWNRHLVKNTPYAGWWAQLADNPNGQVPTV